MLSMNQAKRPFASLGSHLRTVREQSKRSLAEVSGAVEIDQQELELIEAGRQRPDEEVMLLLISYFDVQDQEALHLWELADYDSDLNDHLQFNEPETETGPNAFTNKPMIMLLALDVRTLYSDGLDVKIDPAGVTLQFTQAVPKQSQPVPVARLGMSHAQAELVMKTLHRALLQAKFGGAKRLPPPKPTT
jgi:transcriptional regulator with XRE-family HTH domain